MSYRAIIAMMLAIVATLSSRHSALVIPPQELQAGTQEQHQLQHQKHQTHNHHRQLKTHHLHKQQHHLHNPNPISSLNTPR